MFDANKVKIGIWKNTKSRSGPKHGNVRGDRCWQPPFTTPPIKLMSRLGSCCCFIVSPVLYLFGKDFSQFSISSPAVTCHGGISFRWDSPSHWVINTLTMICPRVFLCIKHDKKIWTILNYFHCKPSFRRPSCEELCALSRKIRVSGVFSCRQASPCFLPPISDTTPAITHTLKNIFSDIFTFPFRHRSDINSSFQLQFEATSWNCQPLLHIHSMKELNSFSFSVLYPFIPLQQPTKLKQLDNTS